MLSRSSSAYQPLEASSNEVVDGGGIATAAAGAHEMTSIAVISAHPTTNATTHQIMPQNGGGSGSANKRAAMADDFADVIRSKHKRQRTPWTGFHSMLLIGIVSFFIFWICLLSKMYLPSEYLWGLVNGSEDEDGNTKGSASLPPLMPPYSKAGNVSDEG